MAISAIRYIAAIITITCLTCVAAMGFEPMTATLRVSGGTLYDYVIMGEHSRATDDFDNVYDTISPGNLNADMGQPFISVIISHSGWKPVMKELRGDIRALAKKQEWLLTIRSSLVKGTPLKVELQTEDSTLPRGVQLTLKEDNAKKETDLRVGTYTIQAPGPGTTTKLLIVAEQP